ncbi:MAG: TauD/TfdA family dioxygenase [Rhodospirillales bacterium]
MSILNDKATTASYAHNSIEIRPLAPAIGAEITGVDLELGVDDQTFAVIHRAFIDHQVIFFRDQRLSSEQHRNLAIRFGKPAFSRKLKMYDGYEDVSLLENDGSKTAIGAMWHTDNTDYESPPMASLLYSEISPAVGGDTIWASMYAAYDALSAPMKIYLDGLTALHDNSMVKQLYAADQTLRSDGVAVGEPTEHPVIRVHPVTGRKAIYVNTTYTKVIVGIPAAESRHILSYLFEHLTRPEFQVRFRWTAGSLAIWDNRCSQHYALDDYSELRRMRRVQVEGDRPAGPRGVPQPRH